MDSIKILIVEDVESMLEQVAQMIELQPRFQVSGRAKNCWEARLELDRRRPDLVLLDEILPGESSEDLLVDINSMSIPVILMTSMENPQHPIPKIALGRLKKPSWKNLSQDLKLYESLIFDALKVDEES